MHGKLLHCLNSKTTLYVQRRSNKYSRFPKSRVDRDKNAFFACTGIWLLFYRLWVYVSCSTALYGYIHIASIKTNYLDSLCTKLKTSCLLKVYSSLELYKQHMQQLHPARNNAFSYTHKFIDIQCSLLFIPAICKYLLSFSTAETGNIV